MKTRSKIRFDFFVELIISARIKSPAVIFIMIPKIATDFNSQGSVDHVDASHSSAFDCAIEPYDIGGHVYAEIRIDFKKVRRVAFRMRKMRSEKKEAKQRASFNKVIQNLLHQVNFISLFAIK
jgi:hypothetical protein